MKRLIILFIITTLTVNAWSQNQIYTPFKDALLIKQSLDVGNKDWVSILQKYDPNVSTLINGNNFLSLVPKLKNPAIAGTIVASNNIPELQNIDPEFSFIPQSQAIDALGTFIANRFKQELNIAYLNKFKEKLASQTELRLLLPVTHKFLLDNEPYNYTDFLESLRASFKEDLNSIPSNLGNLLVSKRTTLTLPAGHLTLDQFIGLILGLEAIQSYINGNSSAEIILNVAGHAEVANITSTNLKSSLEFVKVVTSELSDDVTKDWYSHKEMNGVFGNPEARLIFIGLFYEKYKGIYNPIVSQVNFPNYLDKFYRAYKIVDAYKDELAENKTSGIEITQSDLVKYFEHTIKLLETVSDLSKIGIPRDPILDNKLITTTKDVLEILKNIEQKDYATTFVKTLSFISDYSLSGDFKTDFVKYGNFAVNIVTAENSKEMVKALETAALPVGSYKIKRNTFSNISLNAYAGGFIGGEFFRERGNADLPEDVERTSLITGFSAPIGVAFSTGVGKKFNGTGAHKKLKRFKKDRKEKVLTGASWSIFISVLDVGAVTAFRLTNDEAEALPEFEFENFLAPGIHIIHGFKNSPLSLSIGYQYGPQIRKIGDIDNQDLINASNIRLALLIDIPIVNFFSKSEF